MGVVQSGVKKFCPSLTLLLVAADVTSEKK
ncbi:unnamed protein product [Onchocerca flexuosa]|uniref:40S ribosomal protein S6 n=1 Tax=Onchocerca flexuosa TaxID=387005 RepID=A0A183HJJ5_9BILA|nr:unnamed protein product [Onchocerca flexuosa]